MNMLDNVKGLLGKVWKDVTPDLEPGRHFIDETITVHLHGDVGVSVQLDLGHALGFHQVTKHVSVRGRCNGMMLVLVSPNQVAGDGDDGVDHQPSFHDHPHSRGALTPDLAQWLLQTPEEDRHGPVFTLTGLQTRKPITGKRINRIITRIGEKAGVVVTRETRWVSEAVKDPKTGKDTGQRRRVQREVPKYASAHDLRRAFGT
jgi:hypothetical protein